MYKSVMRTKRVQNSNQSTWVTVKPSYSKLKWRLFTCKLGCLEGHDPKLISQQEMQSQRTEKWLRAFLQKMQSTLIQSHGKLRKKKKSIREDVGGSENFTLTHWLQVRAPKSDDDAVSNCFCFRRIKTCTSDNSAAPLPFPRNATFRW